MILNFDFKYVGLKLYKVHVIDDPGLTLTFIMARSNLVTGFSIDKSENSGFFRNFISQWPENWQMQTSN